MNKAHSLKKILVCDDDTEILFLMEMILRRNGYQVVPLLNSAEIFNVIKAQQPDLILLDLWMPALAGDIILQQLKADVVNRAIPVILISASTEGSTIAARYHADGFIAKPFDLSSLLANIKQLLLRQAAL